MKNIEQSADKLCNSLRILSEVHLRSNHLKTVDLEEAVNNNDRAFELVLEAFHGLYDVSKEQIDYFLHADTGLFLVLRNAIHHKKHPLFNSWNAEMNLQKGHEKYTGATFLLCEHQLIDKGGYVMQQHYCLDDIYNRMDKSRESPYLDNYTNFIKREKLLELMDEQLSFSQIKTKATSEKFPLKQIYINVIPILHSALRRTFETLMSKGFQPIGYDSNVYFEHFTKYGFVDLSKVIYSPIKIVRG